MTGANGFLRGTLRGLARERKRQGVGAEQPFRLIGRADGRLTLEDPATGRRVDLESFGPTNAAVFAQMLMAKGRHDARPDCCDRLQRRRAVHRRHRADAWNRCTRMSS